VTSAGSRRRKEAKLDPDEADALIERLDRRFHRT
jgi:hypothetical protein